MKENILISFIFCLLFTGCYLKQEPKRETTHTRPDKCVYDTIEASKDSIGCIQL